MPTPKRQRSPRYGKNRDDAELYPDPYGIGPKKPSELKVGDRVRFYPIAYDWEKFEDTVVRSEPWQISGHWSVKVEGRAGGVSTQHLCPIPPP